MAQTLATIELGDSHYYLLSDVMAIKLVDYIQMSQEAKADICTATTKFGEPIPEYLISHIKGMPSKSYFYGRRRFHPGRNSKYSSSKDLVRLTDEISTLYQKVRQMVELHNVNGRAFMVFTKEDMENQDVQTLASYVQFTK